MKSSIFFSAAAALIGAVSAKKGRTFCVLRFNGAGPLVEGRMDPIVEPGRTSAHVHTVQGASNFGINSTADDLAKSSCTTAMIKGDMSAYWTPKLYFHDKAANTFEPVEMFYMNVYYFFEGTNDQIKAFPHGLQMVAGNSNLRTAPASGGDTKLTPENPQPASWTCPRSSFDPPSWPANSDGSVAGMGSKNNKGEGVGFPFAECDGYASPLRADLHFPSCYNPAAGLSNWKTNMAFPTNTGNGMQDCPQGWIHVPHLFFEVYWNTPMFKDRWTPGGNSQPFVLSNGDRTGFSMHGDFLSAWDEKVLQNIIDTCDAGSAGMDKCPGVQLNDKGKQCTIADSTGVQAKGALSSLPGNNPLAGWGIGDVNVAPMPNPAPAAPAAPANGAGSAPSKPADNKAASAPSSPAKNANQDPSPKPSPSPSPSSKEQQQQAASPPALTQPVQQHQEPAAVATKVIKTTDAAGHPTMVTVYETVTAWETVYVYGRDAPTPTPDVHAKRHMHNHMLHHRNKHPRRR
ncbi:hypothetical protein GGTG_08144 [Gaeumannomyces tritici R3-111a-1]|uniref:DUF1996 domain-containing protein n=1 Tax=Gaeumannomyces tritici (strain R3-111a-1) TaxID=644352 RepID=J3P3Q7_GAET3|nr:hypothetical protein GGTG_08144 [Gaeumannomyces tritici R3-111a-1]EJT74301.1 hypothetical protein GGTG_08144 [Gaeumannomyces tritici R3-111a-1]